MIESARFRSRPLQPTRDLGGKVFDALVRDRDVMDLVPKLVKSWEPGRYSTA